MARLFCRKSWMILTHDMLAVLASFYLALWLRLGVDVVERATILPATTVVIVAVSFVILLLSRVSTRVWQYTSMPDLVAILQTSIAVVVVSVIALFFYNRLEMLPRSVFLIQWFLLLWFLSAGRIVYRLLRNHRIGIKGLPTRHKINVLLVGIDQHSEAFLRDTVGNPQAEYRVVGLLGLSAGDIGRKIRNIEVIGDVHQLEHLLKKPRIAELNIQKLVVSPDALLGSEVQELMTLAAEHGLTLERLTRLTDFSEARADDTIALRPIALEDLLGRPQRNLDRDSMSSFVHGKRVLITGAGGTIGSELVRQIASFGPSQLFLLDCSEHHLYLIEQELARLDSVPPYTAIIADVRRRDYLDYLFAQHQPEIVFHAAALKHVPLSERNMVEALSTNLFGSKHVADMCVKHQVGAMVMISTDKAVNPSSVMGATKRMAESYVQALGASTEASATQFTTIRFGNVLGSNGSVIPLFQRQLAQGGPLTVTHPEMRRYFMTVREAVQLVVEAAALVHRGALDNNTIFVLDMDEPVYIKDLAEQLIRLSGLTPYDDVDIVYTGMRAGEKLFEELFHGDESPMQTEHDGILIATTRMVERNEINQVIEQFDSCIQQFDHAQCLALLQQSIPEFDHQA